MTFNSSKHFTQINVVGIHFFYDPLSMSNSLNGYALNYCATFSRGRSYDNSCEGAFSHFKRSLKRKNEQLIRDIMKAIDESARLNVSVSSKNVNWVNWKEIMSYFPAPK